MPSGPGVLFFLREWRTLRALHVEMIRDGVQLERGIVGGSDALKSFVVELKEKS